MASALVRSPNGITLPALSMTEPWGTFVAKKVKRCETRSWQTRYRGPIAIHCAQQFPAYARSACLSEPFRSALAAVGYDIYHIPVDAWKTFNLPLGHIIALAQLLEVQLITVTNVPPDPEQAFGNYAPGRYMWLFGEVRELSQPIPVRGNHRLWQWQPPSEHLDEITSLLGQMQLAHEQKE